MEDRRGRVLAALGVVVATGGFATGGIPDPTAVTLSGFALRAGLFLVALGVLGAVFGAFAPRRAATLAALAYLVGVALAAVLALPALLFGAEVQLPTRVTRFAAAQFVGSLALTPLPTGFVLGVAHREARRYGRAAARENALAVVAGYGGPLAAVAVLRSRGVTADTATLAVLSVAALALALGLLAYVVGRAGVDADWRRSPPSLDAADLSPFTRGTTLALLWAVYLSSTWGPLRALAGDPLAATRPPVPPLDVAGAPLVALAAVLARTGAGAARERTHPVDWLAGAATVLAVLAVGVVLLADADLYAVAPAVREGAFWLAVAAAGLSGVAAARHLARVGR